MARGSSYGSWRRIRAVAANRRPRSSRSTVRCGGPTSSTGWPTSPGTFGVAHYHPEFSGNEPCPRVWDPALTASPWRWLRDQFAGLGAAQPDGPGPVDPADAAELSGLADAVVTLARQVSPDRCRSAAECFGLTRDARESVQLMIATVRQRDRLDLEWVKPWQAAR